MNNVSKTWVDPINMNASELNRIEQLIMNTHSNTAILNGEVSTLQNKYLQLSTTLNSLLGSQDTLKTLSELTKLASNNLDILDTLNNTTKLVKASSQEFTKEELTQIYDNLHLNSFLHLKDIRVNGESVIKGSIADIQIATIINNTQSSTSSSSSGSSNSSSDTGSTPSGGTISNKLSDMIQDDLYQTISQEDRDKWNLITKAVFNETDPTVPNWAKQESKPTYLYEEILNRPQKLSELTDDLNYATPSYVDTKVSDLQELLLGPGSTEAIDTIQELATELQNNSEILDTLNQAITNKAPKDHTHTKSQITDFTHTHTKSEITDFTHTHSYLPLSGGTMTGSITFPYSSGLKTPEGDILLMPYAGSNGNPGSFYISEKTRNTIINGYRDRPQYNCPTNELVDIALFKDIPTQYIKNTTVNNDILTITKSDGTTVTFEGGTSGDFLPLSGGIMSGNINFNNNSISNVGHITIADPGAGEGIEWLGGNGWKIYEAPDDLTNAAGNLQFVTGSTRRATITTGGIIEATGLIGMLKGKDTRSANTAPSGYQVHDATMSIKLEFKNYSTIGAPNKNEKDFVLLQTICPWGDESGGRPSQLSYGSKLAYRTASSSSAWNTWRTIIDSGGGAIDSGCTLTINGTLVI